MRHKQDVEDLRKLIQEHGKYDIPIISKIEKPEALVNIKEIVKASNALMVARGDLGVEVPAAFTTLGALLEIFGSGTAVVVQTIEGFGYKGEKFETPLPENSFALMLKEKLMDIQYNNAEDPFNWRYKVCD